MRNAPEAKLMGRLQPGVTLARANAEVAASTSAVLYENAGDTGWVKQELKGHFQCLPINACVLKWSVEAQSRCPAPLRCLAAARFMTALNARGDTPSLR